MLDRLPKECRLLLMKTSIDRFLNHQLSSMLILKTATRFRKPIDAKAFAGQLSVNRFSYHNDVFLAATHCVFSDAAGGWAEGDVLLAYLAKMDAEQHHASRIGAKDHARSFA